MKRVKMLMIWLITLILAAAPLTVLVLSAPMQEASVVGRVVDEDGFGLGGVKVEAYTSGGFLYSVAHTDSDGYFNVYNLPMDLFTFNFSKDGYVDKILLVETDGRTKIDLEEIVLRKALKLSASLLSLVASPGDKILLPFTMSNVGEDKETVKIHTLRPTGWSTRILSQIGEVTEVSLESGISLNLQLEVKIPLTAKGDNEVSLTVLGKTNSTINFTIAVKPPEEHIVFCQFPKKSSAPGDTVRFQVRLENPFRDKVEFKVAVEDVPLNWKTFIKSMDGGIVEEVTLESGEFVDLMVEIQIPPQESSLERIFVFKASSPVRSEDLTLSVMVDPSVGEPRIEYSIEPKKVQADTESTLNIKLTNTGHQDLHRISVKLDTAQNLILLASTEEFFIEELREGESANLEVPVMVLYTSTTTPSKIIAQVNYEDPFNRKYMESVSLSLMIIPKKVEPKVHVEITPEEFQIGKENEATIRMSNNGDSTVKGLEINIESSPPTKVFGSTRIYVDSLNPGEVKEYPIRIYVPATSTAATTTVNALLSYLDSELGSITTDSFSFSILLRGFIELKMVDYASVPSKPSPGQPFSITVTLTNTGTSTAYAAYAFPITRDLPIDTFGPKSVYIGNIEVNTPTTFTLNLILDNTTLTDLEIPTIITYMDNLRTLHNVTYNLHVKISPQPVTSETTARGGEINLMSVLTIGLPIVAVAVLAVFLFRRFRKRG